MVAFAENENILATPERMVLRTENLVKRYGKRTVVNNVSFDVKQASFVVHHCAVSLVAFVEG